MAGYCDYMEQIGAIKASVSKLKRELKKEKGNGVIDVVLCGAGVSGCVLMGAVAAMFKSKKSRFNVATLVVRKTQDTDSHSPNKIEFSGFYYPMWYATATFVFVDDMIETGNTLRHVVAGINKLFVCDHNYDGKYILPEYALLPESCRYKYTCTIYPDRRLKPYANLDSQIVSLKVIR